MEADLKAIWQAYDARLDKSMKVNLHIIEMIQSQQVRLSFRPLVRFSTIAVVLGVFWVLFVGFLLYHGWHQFFFAVGALSSIVFSIIAMIGYIQQIRLINSINYSASITETQEQLAILQVSAIKFMRVMWLSMPGYSIFFIPNYMITHGGTLYWVIQITITGALTFLALWLYRNISFKNKDKKWVKALLWNDGGKSIAKAREFLKEIDDFKKEVG
ncbi:hypothetical protein CLV51_10320 [Chitinophaga niastensis]|uniref:Uncharacterized protein n=1 Tax=Chitinophaga niastensis TaxID=536980 RepID=A0A2P8HIJ8_CHINA|nr:hypothetical protein [Chitinophaga niastensis]PSL46044.1 hypothetical protein CLV51_10320 [Chitinophaga niastensis]